MLEFAELEIADILNENKIINSAFKNMEQKTLKSSWIVVAGNVPQAEFFQVNLFNGVIGHVKTLSQTLRLD